MISNLNTIIFPTNKPGTDLAFSPHCEQICNNAFSIIQHKVIQRTHMTQSKLFKMGLANTGICSQCTLGSTDDYLDAMWLCQPVHSFLITVTEALSTILS